MFVHGVGSVVFCFICLYDMELVSKEKVAGPVNREETTECLKTIDCKQGVVRTVRFNVDGSYCLTGGADRNIKLWNPYRKLALKTYKGHGQDVLGVSSSCDNSHIVSCGKDKSVMLWDVSTGKILRNYHGHASSVTCVQFNEESSVAISGSQDNTVMCWDIKSRRREPIQVMKDAKDTITSLQVTDHEILTGSVDCRVRRYDIRTGELISDFMGEPVTSVRFTWDDQCMVVGCSDNTVRLIDKDTGELLGEYVGHKTEDYLIESCTDSTDKHVISGSVEGDVWCWDLVSAAVTRRLTHARGVTVSSLSAHPKKNVILSAGADVIKLWGDPTTMDSDSD